MFISFFSGKVMLFFGISLIMKEKSNASALHAGADTAAHRPSDARLCTKIRSFLLPATVVSAPACADSRYWRGAKHCSSLCSQSEGDKYWVAKHGMKIQQSNSPERWTCSLRVRGPHFASKVSYSAGAATDDCASTNLHCKGAAYNLGCSKSRKVSVRF